MKDKKKPSPKPFEYSLSERLKFLRESRGLSQKELSNAAGISQATVAQLETGRKDPSVQTLRKLANALDVDIATLFAAGNVHVFDLLRLRRKYNHVDKLTPHIYMALGKIIQYAKDIGFLK